MCWSQGAAAVAVTIAGFFRDPVRLRPRATAIAFAEEVRLFFTPSSALQEAIDRFLADSTKTLHLDRRPWLNHHCRQELAASAGFHPLFGVA